MDCCEILPSLFIGSYPASTEVVDYLIRELHITAVLNLRTDKDMAADESDWKLIEEHYRLRGILFIRVPIEDWDTKDLCEKLPECVRTLESLLSAGHSVYLHCTQGWYRSPSVAIAYLHWSFGWPFDRALSYVTQRRACSPDLEAIRRAQGPAYPRR